jgi:hypothetical protein
MESNPKCLKASTCRGLPQPMVFPDNYPDHKLRGEAKGIEHVLQEGCL